MENPKDNEFRRQMKARVAIQHVCKHCEYWDDEIGECLEGINRALCDCQFSKALLIPEMFPDEDLDDEPNDE